MKIEDGSMDDWDDEGFSMPFSEEDDAPPAEGAILLANMVVIVVMLRSWVSTTNLIPIYKWVERKVPHRYGEITFFLR